MSETPEIKPVEPVEASKDAVKTAPESAEDKAKKEQEAAEKFKKEQDEAEKIHVEGEKAHEDDAKKADEEADAALADEVEETKDEWEAKREEAADLLEEAKESGAPAEKIAELEAQVKKIDEEGKKFEKAAAEVTDTAATEEEASEKKGLFDGLAENLKLIFETIGKFISSIFGSGVEKKETEETADSEEASDESRDDKESKEQPKGEFWEQVKELMKQYNIEDLGDYRKNFFAVMAAIGKKQEAETGVPWQVMAAQACLESGFGKHAPNFNLFGVKAQKGYTGPKAELKTKGYKDGEYFEEKSFFRVYSSIEDSIAGHAKFLKENPRYKNAFTKKDPKEFLAEVVKAKYAEDPNYLAKTTSIIDKYSHLAEEAQDEPQIIG